MQVIREQPAQLHGSNWGWPVHGRGKEPTSAGPETPGPAPALGTLAEGGKRDEIGQAIRELDELASRIEVPHRDES